MYIFAQTDYAKWHTPYDTLINLENTMLNCESRLAETHPTANASFMWLLYLNSFKSVNCHADIKVTLFEPKSIFGGAKQAQFSSC